MMRSLQKLVAILLIICAVLILPVLGETKYIAGSPQLSAIISGTNELIPGNEEQLTIVIENTGLNELKFVQPGIVQPDDLPNTAKFVTVALQPGDAPLVIKSDPQMIGDLKGSSSTKAVFTTKINASAAAGIYNLPLNVNYSYLYLAEQIGGETIKYTYKQVNETIDIPIKIKSDVSIDVQSVSPEHLNVGSEGYLDLKIKNTGYEDGTNAVIKILPDKNSPVVPNDSSVYIGDFLAGSTVEARYKVSVSRDAENQTYPADVVVEYTNKEGDNVTTRSDTIGIPVGSKVDFEIISPAPELNPGNKKVISVEYKNTGETKVYRAQARISAVDPFTSNDDVAYLGDINPGQSATASYTVNVDRTATIKEYGLDTEIRYMDALNTTYVSDPLKVKINVESPTGMTLLLSNPVYLFIIAAGIIGIVILIYRYRKKL